MNRSPARIVRAGAGGRQSHCTILISGVLIDLPVTTKLSDEHLFQPRSFAVKSVMKSMVPKAYVRCLQTCMHLASSASTPCWLESHYCSCAGRIMRYRLPQCQASRSNWQQQATGGVPRALFNSEAPVRETLQTFPCSPFAQHL
jgi:hypothetical protein